MRMKTEHTKIKQKKNRKQNNTYLRYCSLVSDREKKTEIDFNMVLCANTKQLKIINAS